MKTYQIRSDMLEAIRRYGHVSLPQLMERAGHTGVKARSVADALQQAGHWRPTHRPCPVQKRPQTEAEGIRETMAVLSEAHWSRMDKLAAALERAEKLEAEL